MCLLTGGFDKSDCGFLLGGLKKVYLANAEQVDSITDSNTDDVLDLITMVSPTTDVWYEFEFEKDTASFTQELVISNGNRYVTQTLTFSLAGQGVAMEKVLSELSLGKFIAIAETRTGVRTVLGLRVPLEAAGGTSFNSGAAAGDFGGGVVTLVTDEDGYGQEYDSASAIPTTVTP